MRSSVLRSKRAVPVNVETSYTSLVSEIEAALPQAPTVRARLHPDRNRAHYKLRPMALKGTEVVLMSCFNMGSSYEAPCRGVGIRAIVHWCGSNAQRQAYLDRFWLCSATRKRRKRAEIGHGHSRNQDQRQGRWLERTDFARQRVRGTAGSCRRAGAGSLARPNGNGYSGKRTLAASAASARGTRTRFRLGATESAQRVQP